MTISLIRANYLIIYNFLDIASIGKAVAQTIITIQKETELIDIETTVFVMRSLKFKQKAIN